MHPRHAGVGAGARQEQTRPSDGLGRFDALDELDEPDELDELDELEWLGRVMTLPPHWHLARHEQA